MLSFGGLKSLLTIQSTTAVSFLSNPSRTHLNHFASNQSNPSSGVIPQNGFVHSFLRQFRSTHLAFSTVYGPRRNGSRVFALKKQERRGVELLDMEGFDEEEEEEEEEDGDYFDDEEEDDDGDEDDDGSIILPMEKMKKWLESKPRGFGEEKVYDTSIEDNLLEEIEQSREAQAANLNKLKNDPRKPDSKKYEQKKKANEVVPSGVRVRVVNLPKKKNIHRDLSLAFKGVPGLISINPVVSGNKKTRDPICKGFAFVVFKSEEDASRFVQMFSRQSISFGKIQKQIRCEMMSSQTSDSDLEQSVGKTYATPQLKAHGLGEDRSADSDTDDSSPDTWETSASVEYEDPDDDELDMSELEDVNENVDIVPLSKLNYSDSFEGRTESVTKRDSHSSAIERIRALEKKLLAKWKEEKAPGKKLVVKAKGEKASKKNSVVKRKEVIPGSAKRLNVKEKAVLTDVFSKYALKSSPASKNET